MQWYVLKFFMAVVVKDQRFYDWQYFDTVPWCSVYILRNFEEVRVQLKWKLAHSASGVSYNFSGYDLRFAYHDAQDISQSITKTIPQNRCAFSVPHSDAMAITAKLSYHEKSGNSLLRVFEIGKPSQFVLTSSQAACCLPSSHSSLNRKSAHIYWAQTLENGHISC